MKDKTCETCKWWTLISANGTDGNCRRHPPTAIREEYGRWPTTRRYDWCGEHTPKEADGE